MDTARAPSRDEERADIAGDSERPFVFIDQDNLPEVLDQAELAIARRAHGLIAPGDAKVRAGIPEVDADPSAAIFKRGDMLVRTIEKPGLARGVFRAPTSRIIVPVDEHYLAEHVTAVASVYIRGRNGYRPSNFPLAYARHLLARREYPHLLELAAVHRTPTVGLDRRLYRRRGLVVDTGILFDFDPASFPSIPREVGRDDALRALERLIALLRGFPFRDPVDMSVALAMLLTAIVRPMIDVAPLFLISAPTPGSGKSYLARLVGRIATGLDPAVTTFTQDADEFRKRLFALLIEGDAVVAIDNVDGDLGGPEFCALLTAREYKDRVLGSSRMVTARNGAVFVANGNNVHVRGDLGRRTLQCRLDPGMERPQEREFEFDPLELATDERGELVAAVLTVVYGFLTRRGHFSTPRPFGSFEQWSQLVRCPLLWLGLPDPCDCAQAIERGDPERELLSRLLRAWWDNLKGESMTVATLVRRAQELAQPPGGLDASAQAAPELKDVILELAERNGQVSRRTLGRFIARYEDRLEGGLRFVRDGKDRDGSVWRVDAADCPTSPDTSPRIPEGADAEPGDVWVRPSDT